MAGIGYKTILFLAMSACITNGEISGIVTDTGGVALPDASVMLEKGGQTATTGADGRFTLSGGTRLKSPVNHLQRHRLRVTERKGLLTISIAQSSLVTVTVFSMQGRITSTMQKTLGAGSHSVALSHRVAGVCLCKVRAGAEEVVLKIDGVTAGSRAPALQSKPSVALAKPAGIAGTIHDIIAVTKSGFLNYRAAVYNPDTSGMEIKMIIRAGTVSDTDGNVYQTVQIGNQVWTVENLRVTRLNDGSPMTLDTSAEDWLWTGSPEYCHYNNTTNADSIKKYGALYNWYAVSTDMLAPAGWHVPTTADWDTLYNYLVANGYNYDGTTSGNKIAKALAAQCDWHGSMVTGAIGNNQNTNNRSGFGALPGGYRHLDGRFLSLDYNGYWWSATMFDDVYSDMRQLGSGGDCFYRTDRYSQNCGFSVRLVKDTF
jgi:uncharacterized protein (TIGR02145 family)